MCHVTAPPAVFLAGPLQAPYGFGWLLIGGLFAFYVFASYRWYRRLNPLAFFKFIAFAFFMGGLLSLLTSLVISLQVIRPSSDAVFIWWSQQDDALWARHCPFTAITALSDTERHIMDGELGTWWEVAWVLTGVGLGALIISAWVYRRSRSGRWGPVRWQLFTPPR